MLCDILALADVASDVRFKTNAARVMHRDELKPLLHRAINLRGRQELMVLLSQRAVPAGWGCAWPHSLRKALATQASKLCWAWLRRAWLHRAWLRRAWLRRAWLRLGPKENISMGRNIGWASMGRNMG